MTRAVGARAGRPQRVRRVHHVPSQRDNDGVRVPRGRHSRPGQVRMQRRFLRQRQQLRAVQAVLRQRDAVGVVLGRAVGRDLVLL